SLSDDHHYLNCSFLSPLLKRVEEAGIQGIKGKNRPWETTPDHFFEDSNILRSLFAKLVNAPNAKDIAVMPAVSYGLATVAKNIDPNKGSSIVIAGEQFPSNVYAWKRFCKDHDCHLRVIEPPESFENRGQQWNEKLLDAIDSNTLLVALGNVHWTDGTLYDLKSIGTKTQKNDAYFVIDGTQSVGAMPIDVQEIKADALICAGYKWLMGPYAITLGYFGPKLQNGIPLEEGWIVRKNSEDFSGLVDYEDDYQPGAQRFDMGERSNFVLVPMMIEALKQILDWGPQNIQTYCEQLTTDLENDLPEYGYQIEDPKWRAGHMFGIRLPASVSLKKLQQQLDQHNIHVSVRGSAVRISPNVYNDQQDIAMLYNVLKDVTSDT
ncbi:MAG: aminotransferase class V-fold PLP-dependent enzyme, partial [Aliifodinibius sp.]|nr:aminotransferase class V-fold PLP-dependent enzyme [Fodinibius sp.]NIX01565.1 aminotransferase class V-fold PLP-dependent enzyme [Phycisphaerae bacterium]NIY28484.1 aminotransferase class V-fold PLP-dependent enzyme [Fodinibius sp.]